MNNFHIDLKTLILRPSIKITVSSYIAFLFKSAGQCASCQDAFFQKRREECPSCVSCSKVCSLASYTLPPITNHTHTNQCNIGSRIFSAPAHNPRCAAKFSANISPKNPQFFAEIYAVQNCIFTLSCIFWCRSEIFSAQKCKISIFESDFKKSPLVVETVKVSVKKIMGNFPKHRHRRIVTKHHFFD